MTSDQLDRIAFLYLERLWTDSHRRGHGGQPLPSFGYHEQRVLIHSLGIAPEQAASYVAAARSPEELHAWVMTLNNGRLDEWRLRRLHSVLSGLDYDDEVHGQLDSIAKESAVLDCSSLRCWQDNGYVIVRAQSQSQKLMRRLQR